jgi:AbiV family abortive infection protein
MKPTAPFRYDSSVFATAPAVAYLFLVRHLEMQDSSEKWWSSVEETLSAGKQIANSSEQFDLACNHIVRLLVDASTLLDAGSHATATFLAITALEETSKVHMGMYRRSTTPMKRSKDSLYKHDQKHLLALGPTVAMVSRLQVAIGESRMNELIELGRSGGLVGLREAALYVEQHGDALNAPKAAIATSAARELLLLAVEAFDDALVGYTNQSFELGKQTDAVFEKWAGA